MKRMKVILSTLLLFSLLAAIPASATAEDTSLKNLLKQLQATNGETLHSAIAEYLDRQECSYTFDDERQCFQYAMKLDSVLSKCDVSIFLNTDGFKVLAYSPICPRPSDAEQLASVAEYITRANYNLRLGNFEMDYNDGELRYKTSIQCFDRIPSQKEIEWLVDIPPIMIEKYGAGLSNVILSGADPAEEIAKAEQ